MIRLPPAEHAACGNTIYPKPFMRIFGYLWIAVDCPACEMRMMLVVPDPGV